jgi:hypothetical protein
MINMIVFFLSISLFSSMDGGSVRMTVQAAESSTSPNIYDPSRRQPRRPPPPPPPSFYRNDEFGNKDAITTEEAWKSSSSDAVQYNNNNNPWENSIPAESANDRSVYTSDLDVDPRQQKRQEHQRRPPQPPPVFDHRNPPPPIHYSFPVRKDDEQREMVAPIHDPSVSSRRQRRVPPSEAAAAMAAKSPLPKYASARTDAVTRFQSSSVSNRLKLTASCGLLGAGCGIFLSKSMSGKQKQTPSFIDPLILGMATLFIITSQLRNPYGELVRTLGFLLIRIGQRSRYIRKKYPGSHYVLPALAFTERRPYPMTSSRNNPWKKRSDIVDDDDDDFSMWYAILANLLMGGILLGGSHIIPFLPTSLASLLGASVFGYMTTLPDARGDLARVMGMRVVGVVREAVALNSELHVLSKSGVVISNVLDKLLILDRQHRIKDKFLALAHFIYDKVILRVQSDMQRANDDDYDDDDADVRPPPRRPPPRGADPRRPPENWNRSREDASTQQRRRRQKALPQKIRDEKKRGLFSFFSRSSDDDVVIDNNPESMTVRRQQRRRQPPQQREERTPPPPGSSNRYQEREPKPIWNEDPEYTDEQPPIDDPYGDTGSREYFTPEYP